MKFGFFLRWKQVVPSDGDGTLNFGLILENPRLCITVRQGRQGKVVVKNNFDPNETPAEVKRWCFEKGYCGSQTPVPIFKPMRFKGRVLDDDTSMGDQGVPIEGYQRMVVFSYEPGEL